MISVPLLLPKPCGVSHPPTFSLLLSMLQPPVRAAFLVRLLDCSESYAAQSVSSRKQVDSYGWGPHHLVEVLSRISMWHDQIVRVERGRVWGETERNQLIHALFSGSCVRYFLLVSYLCNKIACAWARSVWPDLKRVSSHTFRVRGCIIQRVTVTVAVLFMYPTFVTTPCMVIGGIALHSTSKQSIALRAIKIE